MLHKLIIATALLLAACSDALPGAATWEVSEPGPATTGDFDPGVLQQPELVAPPAGEPTLRELATGTRWGRVAPNDHHDSGTVYWYGLQDDGLLDLSADNYYTDGRPMVQDVWAWTGDWSMEGALVEMFTRPETNPPSLLRQTWGPVPIEVARELQPGLPEVGGTNVWLPGTLRRTGPGTWVGIWQTSEYFRGERHFETTVEFTAAPCVVRVAVTVTFGGTPDVGTQRVDANCRIVDSPTGWRQIMLEGFDDDDLLDVSWTAFLDAQGTQERLGWGIYQMLRWHFRPRLIVSPDDELMVYRSDPHEALVDRFVVTPE